MQLIVFSKEFKFRLSVCMHLSYLIDMDVTTRNSSPFCFTYLHAFSILLINFCFSRTVLHTLHLFTSPK